jgi:hypothetical protein
VIPAATSQVAWLVGSYPDDTSFADAKARVEKSLEHSTSVAERKASIGELEAAVGLGCWY